MVLLCLCYCSVCNMKIHFLYSLLVLYVVVSAKMEIIQKYKEVIILDVFLYMTS